MRTLYRKFGFLLLIVSMLLGPTSGHALAQEDAPDVDHQLMLPQIISDGGEPEFLKYSVPYEKQAAAQNYWGSFEARAAAKPMAMPVVTEAQLSEGAAMPSEFGAPGSSPAGLPAPDADDFAQVAYEDEWLRIEADQLAEALAELEASDVDEDFGPLEADGTKGVYTSFLTNYYGNTWKQFPYKTVGKLYILGVGYCSASVISPNNIIVTAAHCAYNRSTGKWYDWVFVPADRNGSAPYGVWSTSNAIIRTAYATTGNPRYDVALIKLKYKRINSRWRPVSYYTGSLGRSWNYNYRQSLFAQGYPSNLWGGGKYSWTCAAESFYFRADILGMGCSMTYGSSGGPWTRKFHPYRGGPRNYVNGLSSFIIRGKPGTFYGPRFSSYNIVPLCNAFGC